MQSFRQIAENFEYPHLPIRLSAYLPHYLPESLRAAAADIEASLQLALIVRSMVVAICVVFVTFYANCLLN